MSAPLDPRRFARSARRLVTGRFLAALLVLLIVTGFGTVQAFAQDQARDPLARPNNVLILHGLESNVPVFWLTDLGIREALEAGGVGVRHQFFEYLDLVRNPGPAHANQLAELMRLRYGHKKIDLVITLYPEALLFATQQGRAIFGDAPILALYLPVGFQLPSTNQRVIRQASVPDIARTIEVAMKLAPGTKRVYVVSGTHPMDRWVEERARQDLRRRGSQIEYHYLAGLPVNEILATVSQAPAGTIVLLTLFESDSTGKLYTTAEVAGRLSQVSRVPVFGLLDSLLGRGIVGGYVVSFRAVGAEAGRLALRIMEGGQVPEALSGVLDVPTVPMFDWRQLRRWHLSETALPQGSVVVNREVTLWDFRYYIIGGMLLCLAEGALIFMLFLQRRRRALAEESLRRRTEELDQFFNVSLDLLCIANTEGYFERLNPAFERTLGYGHDELMAKPFIEFVHPDDRGATKEALVALASNRSLTSFSNRYLARDGSYRWMEWNAVPVTNRIYSAARDVTARKHAEAALEERLRFEALISSLSARFVSLPSTEFCDEINGGLRSITEFFDADRCTIGLFSEDGSRLSRVFEYRSVGAEPAVESISTEQMPWYLEQLMAGNSVVMNGLEDLPPEAEKERKVCLAKNMKSILSVPLVGAGKTLGSCALVSTRAQRVWPEELARRFRFISEVFAGALARSRMEEQLLGSYEEIQDLKQRLEKENVYLREEIKLLSDQGDIVGESDVIRRTLAEAEKVAPTDSTVLILGETGTGKELVARFIHSLSRRKDRPLVTVNCASLPPSLIESEIFGREKGAYTGALTRMTGRFETADHSTLFLDEIGELPYEVQSKLLRVLEEGKFERLGSTKTIRADVRLIAATNRDLAAEVKRGAFRNDLYYRLNVFPIEIAPLRERLEDIPALVWTFVREFEKKLGKRIESISVRSMESLRLYPWPGNVRELKNAVEHAMIVCDGKALTITLPSTGPPAEEASMSTLEEIERNHILRILERTAWRLGGKDGAAERLGMKRTTLQARMRALGISRSSK